MKLLLFTRAFVSAHHTDFDKTNRTQTVASTRTNRTTRLRCVWSRDADGRLACRWLRDDIQTDEATIPLAAIRRFPIPASPKPIHAPMRTPTQTRVTDFRRIVDLPVPAPRTNDRSAPGRLPGTPEGTDHVRHARPA